MRQEHYGINIDQSVGYDGFARSTLDADASTTDWVYDTDITDIAGNIFAD